MNKITEIIENNINRFPNESKDEAYIRWKENKVRQTLDLKLKGEMRLHSVKDVESLLNAR
jgi:hypothetical protein